MRSGSPNSGSEFLQKLSYLAAPLTPSPYVEDISGFLLWTLNSPRAPTLIYPLNRSPFPLLRGGN
jgi:hypothetical protein